MGRERSAKGTEAPWGRRGWRAPRPWRPWGRGGRAAEPRQAKVVYLTTKSRGGNGMYQDQLGLEMATVADTPGRSASNSGRGGQNTRNT